MLAQLPINLTRAIDAIPQKTQNRAMTKVQAELHIPVMLKEILAGFEPILANESKAELRYFDGTLGRGGHLQALLNKDPRIKAVAMDRDPEAIQYAENKFKDEMSQGRLQLQFGNFSEFQSEKLGTFDLMLLDLGVSSPQLDEGRRGFSFYHHGPLDMRMDTTQGITAAEFVNTASEEELTQLFQTYGEIHKPFRVVRALVHDRKEKKPFETTQELAGLIERVEGWHRKGFHPATQYFMALRLLVNQELQSVESALVPLIHGLKPGGRLAVLTFHSLEDRIVKNLFKERTDLGSPVNKKVIQPQWNEAKDNPRARSAKLRIFERGQS